MGRRKYNPFRPRPAYARLSDPGDPLEPGIPTYGPDPPTDRFVYFKNPLTGKLERIFVGWHRTTKRYSDEQLLDSFLREAVSPPKKFEGRETAAWSWGKKLGGIEMLPAYQKGYFHPKSVEDKSKFVKSLESTAEKLEDLAFNIVGIKLEDVRPTKGRITYKTWEEIRSKEHPKKYEPSKMTLRAGTPIEPKKRLSALKPLPQPFTNVHKLIIEGEEMKKDLLRQARRQRVLREIEEVPKTILRGAGKIWEKQKGKKYGLGVIRGVLKELIN